MSPHYNSLRITSRLPHVRHWVLGGLLMLSLLCNPATAADAGVVYPITIEPVTHEPEGPVGGAGVEGADDRFGESVASAGDVNGDGYYDIVVGASGTMNYTGKVYVFYGSADRLTGSAAGPAWTVEGEYVGDWFGYSVAGAGDLNDDGYSDIVVGAIAANNNAGKVYVFYGGADGMTGTAANPAWSEEGKNEYDLFGRVVAGAGDVNGDGYDDIIVGSPGANHFASKVYVFHGGPNGLTGTVASPAWSADGDGQYNGFGNTVASAGDVNGDAYGDIIVGSAGANNALGKVYVFHGSANGVTGTVASPAWSTVGERANNGFGDEVASAGDVNGDGYGDVVVGAPGSFSPAGEVYVFHGSASGVSGTAASPAWNAEGESGAWLGSSLSAAGDVNGDGYGDIIVGSPGAKNYAGMVYIFHGSGRGVEGTAGSPAWSAEGEQDLDLFGVSVAGVNDVNGDGYEDIVVGATWANEITNKLYVFFGGDKGASGTVTSPAWILVDKPVATPHLFLPTVYRP